MTKEEAGQILEKTEKELSSTEKELSVLERIVQQKVHEINKKKETINYIKSTLSSILHSPRHQSQKEEELKKVRVKNRTHHKANAFTMRQRMENIFQLYIAGKTYEEISETLGISVSKVTYGMAKLSERIDKFQMGKTDEISLDSPNKKIIINM